ncbi:MAG: hypothetical protein IBX61_07865 [Thermoleophilia bacterium]|nr:hypothetical protein [Thermoleophilia bacterium]
MNIQEIVDARVRELRSRALKQDASPGMLKTPPRADGENFSELTELGALADRVLNDIAGRILEIAEQVSGDCARMEKDLLNSRLALLQNAEAVLDMALSLKVRTREVIDENLASSSERAAGDFRDQEGAGSGSGSGGYDRASMISNGVADLFRKTQ